MDTEIEAKQPVVRARASGSVNFCLSILLSLQPRLLAASTVFVCCFPASFHSCTCVGQAIYGPDKRHAVAIGVTEKSTAEMFVRSLQIGWKHHQLVAHGSVFVLVRLNSCGCMHTLCTLLNMCV